MKRNGPGRRALSEAEVARMVTEARAAPRGGRQEIARRYGVSPATVSRLTRKAGYTAHQTPQLAALLARLRRVAERGGQVSFKRSSCAVLLSALTAERHGGPEVRA